MCWYIPLSACSPGFLKGVKANDHDRPILANEDATDVCGDENHGLANSTQSTSATVSEKQRGNGNAPSELYADYLNRRRNNDTLGS